ncbi:MAG: indole-3-glycerol phosphate synthase TrpC, partial [Chitinophagaceae bacterium]
QSPYWNRMPVSLRKALLAEGSTGLIAEFKRKSPSKGWFKDSEFAIERVVVPYAEQGAAAISVLTDTPFFGGTLQDLRQARSAVTVPLLRKDFVIDAYQIGEAKANGADVILLIAACLTPKEVQRLALITKELGMEVLLELHEDTELEHCCEEIDLVGINNRDLKTFTVDIDRSLRMAEQIPAGKIKIAESGIGSAELVQRFRKAGFRGFLIGETFMKTADPGQAFQQFVQAVSSSDQNTHV